MLTSRYSVLIYALLYMCITVCKGQIRCYVCSTLPGSQYGDMCGDNFRLQSIHASKCDGSCQKTRGYRNEGGRRVVEVTRSCVPYTGEGCSVGQYQGITADICTCNEELCNHGMTLKCSVVFAVVFGLLGKILCTVWL